MRKFPTECGRFSHRSGPRVHCLGLRLDQCDRFACRLVFRHQRFTQASKKAVIPGKQSTEDRGYSALGKSLISALHLKQGKKKIKQEVVVDSMKIAAVANRLVWKAADG